MSWQIGKTQHRKTKKSAEELVMGIPALRQYIDATMYLGVNRQWGTNLQRLWFPVSILRAFFTVCRALPKNADWLAAPIGNTQYKRGKQTWIILQRFAYSVGHCLSFCFTGAETEIDKIKGNSKIDRETHLHRRGPSRIGTDWHIPDPHTFSLPTTFNALGVIYDNF